MIGSGLFRAAAYNRLLIRDVAPELLRDLGLICGGILLGYCVYYALKGDWAVAFGGLLSAISLLAMATIAGVRGGHPALAVILVLVAGVNAGAVIAIAGLGPLGLVWFVPLLLLNHMLIGVVAGGVLTIIAIVAIFALGRFDLGAEFFINTVGALGLAFVIILAIVAATRTHIRQLETQANVDPLTGALNRRGLGMVLDRLLRSADLQPLSLIILDLDHFKALNDRHGHQVGDAVLQEFVRLCNRVLRKHDRVYRFGGEEFVVVVDGDADAALVVAEKIRMTVEEGDFHVGQGVTVSAGIAQAAAGEAQRDLIRRADAALYRSKSEGRNRCRVARPGEHMNGSTAHPA